MVSERFPNSVREQPAPYRPSRSGSMRTIQGEAAELLRHLAHSADLPANTAGHLRAGDVDLDRRQIAVRNFDGVTVARIPIPTDSLAALRVHLAGVRLNHERDRIQGLAGVWVPPEVRSRDPRSGESWSWYWLFPARHVVPEPVSGRPWRPPVEAVLCAERMK